MTDHNTTPRRRDRALTDDDWIVRFLNEMPSAVVTTAIDNQPYSNVNSFVYDPDTHAVYVHTAGQGRLRSEVDANPKVCVSTSRIGRLLPAIEGREMSVEFESVVIFGQASIVTDMTLALEQMQRLIEKYFGHLKSGTDYVPITEQDVREITVIRIDVEAWSGKGKYEAGDFPGAFKFGHPPRPGADESDAAKSR